MRAGRHTIGIAALLAAALAGCSASWIPGMGGEETVSTGSVAPPPPQRESAPEPASVTPSLVAFEATELVSGLKCTGNYSPLENSATFTAGVVCEDGRTGKVTAPRSHDLGGTGTLVLTDGDGGAVTLRRLDGGTT